MKATATLPDRLKALRTALKITQKKLSEVLVCSQGKVSDYESGKLSISNNDLSIIANTYNVNLTWLITGTGPMFNNVPARAKDGTDPPPSKLLSIPVVADIAAGIGIEADDLPPSEFLSIDRSLLPFPGRFTAFRVCGVSMEPELHDGDYAVVASWVPDHDYDGSICAFRSIDGLLIKRLVYHHSRRKALLIPLNPSQPIIQYDSTSPDLVMLGRLVAIIRKYI